MREMKKPGGADKKRVRRSSAALQNGSRDPNSDSQPRKQGANKDVFQLFAEKVRDHKDLVSRWAVLQETRVEYVRGKDFVSFLKNHPEVKEILDTGKNLEVEEIANTLLSKNLLVRCDRVVKTIRPGKKKLSTWPAHLEIFPDQVFSDNDAFFAWAFVKRRPLWQTLLSFFWPVLTLAICLFPVYPHRCKLLILYSCASVLFLILSLLACKYCRLSLFSYAVDIQKKQACCLNFIAVRATIFGALYVLIGKRVWFFPNILAEEATLRELFRFLPQKDEEDRPKWTTRLLYTVVAVSIILLLRHHAPDEAARARYQKRMSNIIDDVLEWSPKLALSGFMDKPQDVANVTDSGNDYAGGDSEAHSGHMPPVEDTEEEEANKDGGGAVESNEEERSSHEKEDDV
ncbi:hypothetical protein LINPERHAP1_LOCUS4170 [Linum perenne]